jgi:hypothetical protein
MATAPTRVHPVGKTASAWAAYLTRPVDGASLAAFRILFGLLLAWEAVRYFEHGWIARYYIQPTFFFTYPFFDFLAPWPGQGMYLHFVVLGVLAVFIALGLCYRLCAVLFWLAFTYVFLLDKANYLNHFYLISLLSFLLIFVPAQRVASLDRRWFFPRAPTLVPFWSVLILRAQIFIVYFYAGLAKLNADWLRGEPMRAWLAERTDFPLIGHLFTEEWLVYAAAYGALVFDLGIGFLLAWKPGQLVALALAGGFHYLNSQLFSLGIFPALAFASSLLFFAPDWPRQAAAQLRRLWSRPPMPPPEPPPARASSAPPALPSAAPRLVFLHLYLAAQLLIPLRQLLYPGNVSWTEEGHRFAWHMKLRDKSADLRVFVTDPVTHTTWEVDPATHLSDRQLDEMETRPDMIHQYVQYLANQLSAKGQPRPIIHVHSTASLNGRAHQHLIDPNVNLAAAPLDFGPSDWIVPLHTPLSTRE